MRPRPTQACPAAHIGQCSPEVYTVVRARLSGVRLSAAQRAIANSGWRVWSPFFDAVAVLVERGAVAVDENRAERFIAIAERDACEFHAAGEALEVVVIDRHRAEFTQPRARAAESGSG